MSLSELGVIPGTTDLSASAVVLEAAEGISGFKSGAEVFSTEVAFVKTSTCFYRDVAYQVVMPKPSNFIPDITCYVRSNVCSGADPWDHVRMYLSVCIFQNLFLELGGLNVSRVGLFFGFMVLFGFSF